MKDFKVNSNGGIDVFDEKDKLLLHLNSEELKVIYDIQQQKQYVDTVRGRVSTWVGKQTGGDCDFSYFNSFLASDDKIYSEQICQKILGNDKLIEEMAVKYRSMFNSKIAESSLNIFVDCAIAGCVSVWDVMGEILSNKQPKELCVGKWKVVVVEQGETDGTYGTAAHNNFKPVVEFYDMSQDKAKFPNGQFTGGRYFLDTLLNSNPCSESIDERVKNGVGLILYGDVPEWTVAPGELAVIAAWLHKVQDKLIEKTQEKVVYRGDVGVPFGYGKLAEAGFEDDDEKIAEDIIKTRLSVIPEFNDVTVEEFGQYVEGYGVAFTFVSTVDATTAEALLKHAFNGLNYELYNDDVCTFLENTLAEAQKRSQKNASDGKAGKDERDFDK